MKLSIIIPLYNTEKYLCACVNSCLKYDNDDYEVILVNDGSIDSSLEICRQYERDDSRVKVIDKQNGGLSSARNAGIATATGEFLFFLDSDDYLRDGAIEILLRDTRIDSRIVCYNYCEIDQKQSETPVSLNKNEWLENFDDIISAILGTRKKSNWFAWGKLYQTKFLKESGIKFDTDNYGSEDLQFNFQVFSQAKRVFFSDQVILNYRIDNQASITKNVKEKTLFCLLDVIDQCQNILFERQANAETKQLFFDIFADWLIFCIVRYRLFHRETRAKLRMKLKENHFILKKAKTSEAKKMRILLSFLGYRMSSILLQKIKNCHKGKS